MDGFEPMGRALVIIGIFITVLGRGDAADAADPVPGAAPR